MLLRKFTVFLEHFLQKESDKILLVNGARQIGKSYLIRYVGQKLFPHFVEINLKEDSEGERVFADVHSPSDLYMRLGNYYSSPLGDKSDTLIFLDEIQNTPKVLESLKYFCEEAPEYHIVAAGSLLGVAIHEGVSYPVGKVDLLDFAQLKNNETLFNEILATGVKIYG